MKKLSRVVFCLLGSFAASYAAITSADVFNMPAGQASLQFDFVGDVGNAADTTGYGAVGYAYKMGEYDVTAAQYCQFLNAVATTDDPYSLWNSLMASEPMGGSQYSCGVNRSYNSDTGLYSYSVASGCNNFPVNFESWGSAARFVNWVDNGQPSYPGGTPGEVAGSTETGAYALDGDTTNLLTETRTPGETYYLPSLNEWYKAAYYKGGGTNAGYWQYPTQSTLSNPPNNIISATLPNHANFMDFNDPSGATGNDTYTTGGPTADHLTAVGTFAASPGPYGTYDMGGLMNQWDDTVIGGPSRGEWGGSWYQDLYNMQSTYSYYRTAAPTLIQNDFGFRMVEAVLPGDANLDGKVDINDLTIVLANYGQTGMTWAQGEFTGDGTVDINDLTIVLANYDQTLGASAAGLAAVPEPGPMALLAAGLAGLVAYTWRKRRDTLRGLK
jgi:formylglycine-generating enzyme required for sulfatase activity